MKKENKEKLRDLVGLGLGLSFFLQGKKRIYASDNVNTFFVFLGGLVFVLYLYFTYRDFIKK